MERRGFCWETKQSCVKLILQEASRTVSDPLNGSGSGLRVRLWECCLGPDYSGARPLGYGAARNKQSILCSSLLPQRLRMSVSSLFCLNTVCGMTFKGTAQAVGAGEPGFCPVLSPASPLPAHLLPLCQALSHDSFFCPSTHIRPVQVFRCFCCCLWP